MYEKLRIRIQNSRLSKQTFRDFYYNVFVESIVDAVSATKRCFGGIPAILAPSTNVFICLLTYLLTYLCLLVAGACQVSLYNSTVVLLTLWTGYQHTANEVADVHSEETNLDTIQSQVYSLHQYLTADNESTSLYSVWSYLNDRIPPMNDSLLAIATQVSYSCLRQGRYAF